MLLTGQPAAGPFPADVADGAKVESTAAKTAVGSNNS